MSDASLRADAATGRLLRRPEVERETGMSRSSIYRLMDEGQFPRPLRTGHRMVAWSSAAIDAWKASRALTQQSEM
jgi:prophage regulatory protein